MKYLLIVILFIGCNPVKKALKVAEDNPADFAKFCADAFPVKDTVITKDSIWYDTIYLENEVDPIVTVETIRDTVYKTIKLPGTTYFVTKTVTKDSLVIRRDIAKETTLQQKVDDLIIVNADCIGDRDKARQKRDWWMWIAIALGAAWVIKIVLSLWGNKFNIGGLLNAFKKK